MSDIKATRLLDATKLALEAFNHYYHFGFDREDCKKQYDNLHQAIAEAEAESLQQEPVKKGLFIDLIAQHPGLADELKAMDSIPIQPKREWVGLTDEEFAEAAQIAERGNYLVAFHRIQTKLKEKNT